MWPSRACSPGYWKDPIRKYQNPPFKRLKVHLPRKPDRLFDHLYLNIELFCDQLPVDSRFAELIRRGGIPPSVR